MIARLKDGTFEITVVHQSRQGHRFAAEKQLRFKAGSDASLFVFEKFKNLTLANLTGHDIFIQLLLITIAIRTKLI